MLSCTYPNDLQYNIVVMKASIKPWRQGLEPRLKGHQYASLSRREGEIKEMVEPIHWIIDRILWGTQISLFEKSRHNHLATQLYTSFSQLSPLKNLVVGYCIRLTWPRTQSLWITKPHSLLSSLQTLIPFSSLAKFLSLVCGILKLFPFYPCYSSFSSIKKNILSIYIYIYIYYIL